jgi:acyl-CoA hydrolase
MFPKENINLENKGIIGARESVTLISHVVLSEDTNSLHILLGGRLMEWMDLASEITAQKHSQCIALTARIQEINFYKKIGVGDIVTIKAQITRVFNSSMEILVEVFTEHVPELETTKTSDGLFTMVAVDLNGKPIRIRDIQPETEKEIRLFKEAGERKKQSLKKKLNK